MDTESVDLFDTFEFSQHRKLLDIVQESNWGYHKFVNHLSSVVQVPEVLTSYRWSKASLRLPSRRTN